MYWKRVKKNGENTLQKHPKHTSSEMLISVLHVAYVNVGVCNFKPFRYCAYATKQWELGIQFVKWLRLVNTKRGAKNMLI